MLDKFKIHIDKTVKAAEELELVNIDSLFYNDTAVIKIYFHGGFDYKKKSATPQRLLFQSSQFESFLKHHRLRFEELKVTVPYYEEPELLLMAFGNDEIEAADRKNLNSRKNRSYPTLPLIIFTEDFFHIPYGEILAYTPVIETLEGCCENKVVAFSEAEVRSYDSCFSRYLFCISFFKRTLDLIKIAEEAKEKFSSLIVELYDEKDTDLDLLMKSVWIKQLSTKLDEADKLLNTCSTLRGFIFQELFNIQEENKINVLKRLKYFKASPYASTFAKDILLKYGTVINEIDNFTEEISNNKLINSDYQIVRRMEDTRYYMEGACEFAVIGTFSSGKTTFINTLLASRHKLRTSAAHNTAVLLKIFKADEKNGEYSRVIYKDRLELDLIEPASTNELAQLYNGQENGKVVHVDRVNQTIRVRCGNVTSVIYIENEKPIIVAEGDILKSNDKLTEGYVSVHNCRRVKCVSREELQTVLQEVSAKRISELNITMESEKKTDYESGNRAVSIIESLVACANDKESTIDIQRLIDAGLDNYYHIKLTGKYSRSDSEIKLDNNGWSDFCDNADKAVYIERPECYLLAKEIHVFMKSDFLEYCTVIDTPGFGSVTEKHDAISERYLMEHNGILLIMIKVNNQTDKLSMRVLLNKVESIYNNNNMNKNNVTFILNCFSNSTSQEHIINSCRNVNKLIVDKGFSKNKIFVCNLKRSIEENEYLDKIYNEFPSYKMFFSSIKREIEEKGMLQKLMQVNQTWEGFFEGRIYELLRQNSELKNTKLNRERTVSENEFALKQITNIQMKDFSVIKERYMEQISPLINMMKGLSSKKEWKISKEDIFSFLDTLLQVEDLVERDFNKVYDIASKANMRDSDIPKIEDKKRFKLPIEHFKNVYEDILYNRSWGLFRRHKEKFRLELCKLLEVEIEETLKGIEDYYNRCSKRFSDFKKDCIKVITQRINSNSENGSSKAVIENNTVLIKEYTKFNKSWKVVSGLIHKTDEMKNIS
jgi:hypothetical protein